MTYFFNTYVINSMYILNEYGKINTKKIICLDKNFISEKYRTQKIQYKETTELQNCYIQTPYIFNRFAPSSFEGNLDNKIHLDLQLDITESKNIDDNTEQINNFYEIISKIQRILKNRTRKKNIEKLKFVNSIKEKDNRFTENKCFNFRTKIHSMNGNPYLRVFDSNRQTIKDQKLRPNFYIRYIIHLDSIWFFENTYGINWYIVQAEIKLPDILNNYSFYNENEPFEEKKEKETSLEEQHYGKYLKMLKMGIPEQAVKNKMIMDGIEPSILDNILLKKRRILPIPPPPHHPPLAIGNIKLKKVVGKDINKAEKIKIDMRIPSQSQLLEQMRNLKKVSKV